MVHDEQFEMRSIFVCTPLISDRCAAKCKLGSHSIDPFRQFNGQHRRHFVESCAMIDSSNSMHLRLTEPAAIGFRLVSGFSATY